MTRNEAAERLLSYVTIPGFAEPHVSEMLDAALAAERALGREEGQITGARDARRATVERIRERLRHQTQAEIDFFHSLDVYAILDEESSRSEEAAR